MRLRRPCGDGNEWRPAARCAHRSGPEIGFLKRGARSSRAVSSATAFATRVLLYQQSALMQAAIGGLGADVGLIVGCSGYADGMRGTRSSPTPASNCPSSQSPHGTRHPLMTLAVATR